MVAIEERVAALETEVARMRLQLQVPTSNASAPVPWWERRFGAFENDPDYDEAMRLGREWRENDLPDYENDVEADAIPA